MTTTMATTTTADDVVAMMAAGTGLDDDICSLDNGVFITDDPLFTEILDTVPLEPEAEWPAVKDEASLVAEMLEHFEWNEIIVSAMLDEYGDVESHMNTSELRIDDEQEHPVTKEENAGDDGTDVEHTEFDDAEDSEEVELLQKEVQYLEARKKFLAVRSKRINIRKRGSPWGQPTGSRPQSAADVARSTVNNDMMRNLLAQQQFMIDNMQAMLSFAPVSDVRLALMTPMESFIHLGSEFQERRNTIMRIRDEKLDITGRYLIHKSQGLDKEVPYRYNDAFERFGKLYRLNFFQTKFDNVQIHEVVQILRNLHPPGNSVSHEFGCTMVNKFCDSDNATFKHRRMLLSVELGATSPVVESNMLLFFRDLDSEGRALFVADSVDKDDLYPYDTDKNIRVDTSFGWMFEPYIDSKGVQCVIMRRFALSRCHLQESRMPNDAKEMLITKLDRVFEVRLQRFVDIFRRAP